MKKLLLIFLLMPCWCTAQVIVEKCKITKIGLPSKGNIEIGLTFPTEWHFDCEGRGFYLQKDSLHHYICGWTVEELDSIYYAQFILENGVGYFGTIGIAFDSANAIIDSGRITFEGSGGSLAERMRLDGNGNLTLKSKKQPYGTMRMPQPIPFVLETYTNEGWIWMDENGKKHYGKYDTVPGLFLKSTYPSTKGKIFLGEAGIIEDTIPKTFYDEMTGGWRSVAKWQDTVPIRIDNISLPRITKPVYFDTVPIRIRPTEPEPAEARGIIVAEPHRLDSECAFELTIMEFQIDSLKKELLKCQEKPMKDEIILKSRGGKRWSNPQDSLRLEKALDKIFGLVKVIMLVSDTSTSIHLFNPKYVDNMQYHPDTPHEDIDRTVYWIEGYKGISDTGSPYYLGEQKERLSKNIIVWQSKEL